jgi:diguanylate cyclase (GGDEF)-like protein
MDDTIKPSTLEITDQETFRQTIIQLDTIITRGWRSMAAATVLMLVTTVAQVLLKNQFAGDHLKVNLVVSGLVTLTFSLSAYGLAHYSRLRELRNRLLEQLALSLKQRRRADKLYGLSILDPLTGLHNRRFGEQRLQEEIERAETTGDPLALILVDLDRFKDINDQFGHAAGDIALKEFSRKLRKAIRACDVPVRIGGDEFLVILPDCPREKVNVILSRLGTPEAQIDARKLSIHYSVGRSQYQPADTIKTMLGRADEVLYAEKRKRSSGSRTPPEASKWSALAMGESGTTLSASLLSDEIC